MKPGRVRYPRSLRDIPSWRERELRENIVWFSRFSAVQRLDYIDREWEETRRFIERFGFTKPCKRKKK